MSAVTEQDDYIEITEYSPRIPAHFTLAARLLKLDRDDWQRWAHGRLVSLQNAHDAIYTLRGQLDAAQTKATGYQIITAVLALGYLVIWANTYIF